MSGSSILLHLAVAMIPLLLLRFSPLICIPLTLWVPPSRRLTVLCAIVSSYYHYVMSRLPRLFHITRIYMSRALLFRISVVLMPASRINLSHSLHELSLQQISILVLWWKRESHGNCTMEAAYCAFRSNGNEYIFINGRIDMYRVRVLWMDM